VGGFGLTSTRSWMSSKGMPTWCGRKKGEDLASVSESLLREALDILYNGWGRMRTFPDGHGRGHAEAEPPKATFCNSSEGGRPSELLWCDGEDRHPIKVEGGRTRRSHRPVAIVGKDRNACKNRKSRNFCPVRKSGGRRKIPCLPKGRDGIDIWKATP